MLFKVGTKVRLKTGGPVMIVVGVMSVPEIKLSCEWVREDLYWDNAWYKPSELVRVSE